MAADANAADGGRFKAETSRRICNAFRHECLRKSPFFAERKTNFLEEVICELEVELFLEGNTIIQQGEHGEKMYFLYCGQVDILIGPEEVKVATLESGSVFGEMALFGLHKRAATVRAAGFCDCRVINHRAFNGILRRYPEDRAFFTKMAEERGAQLQQINAEKTGQGQEKSKKLGAGLRQKMRMVAALKGGGGGPSRAHSATPGRTRSTTPSDASSRAEPEADEEDEEERAPAEEVRAVQTEPVSLPGALPSEREEDAAPSAAPRALSRPGSAPPCRGEEEVSPSATTRAPSSQGGAGGEPMRRAATAAAPTTPLILRTAQKVSRFMSALPPELPPRIMPRAGPLATAAGLAEAQGMFAEVTQPCFQMAEDHAAKFARCTPRPQSHCASTGHAGRITKVYRDLSKAPAKKIGRESRSKVERKVAPCG